MRLSRKKKQYVYAVIDEDGDVILAVKAKTVHEAIRKVARHTHKSISEIRMALAFEKVEVI